MRPDCSLALTIAALLLVGCGGGGSGEVVVLNPGDGLPVEAFYGMDVADMDGDGLPDLVAASVFSDGNDNIERRLNVLLQDAASPGTFRPRTILPYVSNDGSAWNVQAVDLKLSGLPDVLLQPVTAGGFFVFAQDPANPGTVLAPVRIGPTASDQRTFVEDMAVGDIDGDLFPDVLLTADENLVYYPQDSANPGSFLPGVTVGAGTGSATIGDVNGDGLADVLTFEANPSDTDLPRTDTLFYHRQNPLVPGQFLAPIDLFFDFGGNAISLADLDGNMLNDLIIVGTTGTTSEFNSVLTFFTQPSPDNFVRGETRRTPGDVFGNHLAIADLDDDGDPDIVVGQRSGAVFPNQVTVFLQDANGTYSSSTSLIIPDDQAIWNPELFAVRIADLDGDQQPDIAVSTYELFILFQQTGFPGIFRPATRIIGQR